MATLISKLSSSLPRKGGRGLSIVVHSPEAMHALGLRLAKILKRADVVALIGELGSGKTTLVQGIAAGWGYYGRAISPTFALVNEYPSARGPLRHMDMYRLSAKELESFPLEDYLDRQAVCVIEWADKVRTRLPAETLLIHLAILTPDTRRLEIRVPGSAWRRRLADISL